MKTSNKLGSAALISMALVLTACGSTVPQKPENIKQIQAELPKSLAAMQEMGEGLTPKTQMAMLALGISLPSLPLVPMEATDLTFLKAHKTALEVSGLNLSTLVHPQGTPQDPDTQLERGTYERDDLGKETKISDEPKNGKVIHFTEEEIPFTQTTIYNEIAVLSTTSGNTTLYSEYLVDYQTTLVSGEETLMTATINQDVAKCTYQAPNNITYDNVRTQKASVVLNIADQITAKGNLSLQGRTVTASGEFNMTTDKHKLAVKGNVNFTGRTEPTCAPLALPTDISDGDINVNVALDSNNLDLMASLRNFSSTKEGNFGDLDAKLVYSTPQYYANLFTAKGKLQDGPDEDTIPGDQLDITVVLPKFTVSTNWQSLMELLDRNGPPMLGSLAK